MRLCAIDSRLSGVAGFALPTHLGKDGAGAVVEPLDRERARAVHDEVVPLVIKAAVIRCSRDRGSRPLCRGMIGITDASTGTTLAHMTSGDDGALRIVTFNIRHGAPQDSYRGLPDQLAEACAALNADVLGLQEVDVGIPRSQFADLARVAADACGMTYYFGKARKHNYRGQYGNALLVRGEISDVEVVPLKGDHRHNVAIGPLVLKPFREPRNVIVATATVGGRSFSVSTGHLAVEAAAKHAQLTTAAARLVSRPSPRILLGDFNIGWHQAASWLAPYGLTLAEALLTPADPAQQDGIDHVAVEGLTVQRVEVRWLPVSDHPAKIVDVGFPGG